MIWLTATRTVYQQNYMDYTNKKTHSSALPGFPHLFQESARYRETGRNNAESGVQHLGQEDKAKQMD